MPDIDVRDATGKLLHTYQIHADGYGTLITDEHLIEMAKRNAIEDELASEDTVETLTFTVAGAT